MKISAIAATVAFFVISAANADPDQLYEELVEWVYQPCMDVAAAIEVASLDSEARDLGIRRNHLSELMLASRETAIRDIAGKLDEDAAWEARSAAYPVLLRVCIESFMK